MRVKSIARDFLYRIGLFRVVAKSINVFSSPLTKYKIRKLAKPIICKVSKVLGAEGEDYWLDYGTLLGYVREGKIIEGDDDLDFGVIIKKDTNLSGELAKHDIYITKRLTVEGVVAFEQYKYKGLRFDIFHYIKSEDEFVTHFWFPHRSDIPQKISYIRGTSTLKRTVFKEFNTEEISFYGCSSRAPEDAEGYLTQNYGHSFMEPNSAWGYDDELNSSEISKEFIVEFFE